MTMSQGLLLDEADKPLDLGRLKAIALRRRHLFMHIAMPLLMLTFIVALALPRHSAQRPPS